MANIALYQFAFRNSTKLCFLSRKIISQNISCAGICHKDNLDPEVMESLLPPWPYKTKKLQYYHHFLGLDLTTDRFHENTAIICVDGPLACGKSKFAKQLANELGMKYVPEPNSDTANIVRGQDFRKLNKLLPRNCHFVDNDMIVADPYHPRAGFFQHLMLKIRYYHYLNTLIHVLNTGQGAVIERSPWTDLVFMESMYKSGFVNLSVRDFYYRKRNIVLREIWRPHLVIYIDTPIEKVIENIKKRNKPCENHTKFTESQNLEIMDSIYKDICLPEISKHAHILNYDYSENMDMPGIIQDIESIEFKHGEYFDEKLDDWRKTEENAWFDARINFSNNKQIFASSFNLPSYDVEGYDIDKNQIDLVRTVVYKFVNFEDQDFKFGKNPLWKVLFGKKNYLKDEHKIWFELELIP